MSHDESSVSPHHLLIFDHVVTNQDGSYNPHIGVFIAPEHDSMYLAGQWHAGAEIMYIRKLSEIRKVLVRYLPIAAIATIGIQ